MPIEADDCLGYQRLTAGTAIASLTVPTGAGAALVQAQTADVCFREDTSGATALASGTGLVLTAGSSYRSTSPSSFRAIRSGTVDATLHVLYYEA